MAAFGDLNLAFSDSSDLDNIIETGVKLGYSLLAVTTFVAKLKGKEKKQQLPSINLPKPVTFSKETQQLLKVEHRSVRQLSRVTVLLDDVTNTRKLNSPEVQAFDLIAVQPVNETAFKLACTTLEVDIIVLNMTERLPFKLTHKLINLAIERGMHFEILYAPAVRDSSLRQNTISNALQLNTACKGKGVIISSGCEKAIELRGPYDISNLGLLFGLSSPQSKDAVSRNCRAVLKHAEARKITKSVIGVMKASQLSAGDEWIVQHKLSPGSQSEEDTHHPPPPKKLKT